MFRLNVILSNITLLRNSQVFEGEEEEEELPVSPRPDVETLPPIGRTPPPAALSQQEEADRSPHASLSKVCTEIFYQQRSSAALTCELEVLPCLR